MRQRATVAPDTKSVTDLAAESEIALCRRLWPAAIREHGIVRTQATVSSAWNVETGLEMCSFRNRLSHRGRTRDLCSRSETQADDCTDESLNRDLCRRGVRMVLLTDRDPGVRGIR